MTRKSLAYGASALALSLGMASGALAQTTTLNGGGATLPQPTYQNEFTAFSNSTPSVAFSYDGVGSGGGQTAFLTDSISAFNNSATQYGTIVGSTVHFAASDAFLSSSQVSGYTRASTDGALIQLPMLGVAVTIPYNNAGLGTTALKLTDDQLCGVLSGKINTWQALSKTATPGTITVVYRSDGSGTSFLLTQHLNAVCTSANSSFASLPVPVTKTFNTIFANSTPPSNFVGQSGSSSVAGYMTANAQSLGYLSPDYTSIAPKSSNTTSLLVASLVNATSKVAYAPTVKNTTAGLNNPGPTSTNATPPANQSAASNPVNWIPAIPTTKTGYPIVGYTTWEVSTCYNNKTAGLDMVAFLKKHFSTAYTTIINNNGLVPLANTAASPYTTQVIKTFLSNTNGYNLNIGNTTACAGLAGR